MIYWACNCGFREPVRCPQCHNIITLYLRNGINEQVTAPGFFCQCGFFTIPEVCS